MCRRMLNVKPSAKSAKAGAGLHPCWSAAVRTSAKYPSADAKKSGFCFADVG